MENSRILACKVAFVFEGIYHQSPGISGLMFLPIGLEVWWVGIRI
jgi:hypothetical protein